MCTSTDKINIICIEKARWVGSLPRLKKVNEFLYMNTCSDLRLDGDGEFNSEKIKRAGIKYPVLVYNDAMDLNDIRSSMYLNETELPDIRRKLIIDEGGSQACKNLYAVDRPVCGFWRD